MWVEATKPLRVEFQSRAVSLRPGEPIELPDESARKLLVQARGKVREVLPVQVDALVSEVVSWHGERGLVRLTLLDQGARWAWVETASREGWTRVYTAALPCHRCNGSRWWWSRARAIRCGFNHDWTKSSGAGHPSDRDHLTECAQHRFRWAESLSILCVRCHPPMPDWASERLTIDELTQGLTDSMVATLALACDAAITGEDYSAFLVQKERLRVYVGGLLRGIKR